MLRTLLPLLFLAAPLAAQQRVTLPERDRSIGGTPATALTFGREEGESWQLLSNVSGVDFDAADNLYILDAGNHRVVVVDVRGRLVRTIGRRGGGPGELLAPTGLAVLEDGSVAVADLGRGAFSIFGPDGGFRYNLAFVDSLGQPGPEQRGSSPTVLPHPNGLAVFGSVRIAMDGARGGGPPTPPRELPVYVRPLAERASARVLYRIPRDPPLMRSAGSETNRTVRNVPRLLVPQPAWAVLPDGSVAAVHGTSPDYRIHIIDAAGRATRVLERPIRPRPVTRSDQERARELLAERLRSGTGMLRVEVRAQGGEVQRSVSTGGGSRAPDEEAIQAQLREAQFGEVIPVVSGLRADPRGRLWIARAPRRVGEDGPIDLVSADGRYLGTLSPQPLPDAFSRSGLTAYITVNDLGVEQVVVKRLPASLR